MTDQAMPEVVDHATWQAEIDKLRACEKAHTREGDAIAAARRRLPMVELDANIALRRTPSTSWLVGRHIGLMHIVCYLRDGDRIFETYWTTRRGVEAMDDSLALMDLTVYGHQAPWEDSPPGWPQEIQVDGSKTRTNGRPAPQWSRLAAGRSDDLGTAER